MKVAYRMIAGAGQSAELVRALAVLATTVRALPGCIAVDVLADLTDPHRVLFEEHWTSADAYDHGAKLLPPGAFAPLKPLLDAAPERTVWIAINQPG